MQQKTIEDVARQVAKLEQEKQAAEIVDLQNKLVTVAYDKAAAYTTVIVFGGYAGFFAVWQLAKDHMSKAQILWSAILILVSLATFVLFEVIKMAIVTRSLFKRAAVLQDPAIASNPQKLISVLRSLDDAQVAGAKTFMIFWSLTVFVSLGSALGGAVVLGYAFISGLAT